MSQFSYTQYTNAVNAAQNKTNSTKVGYFKLSDDGDEALVRINVRTPDDLKFSTIHQLSSSTRWMKVSCLNSFGSHEENCPFCKAVAEGKADIGKAMKRVYIEMLVSYKDKMTGQWSNPQPVVWERPAGFSRDIANMIRDYGDLTKVLLKITRNGKAHDMQTTYPITYAVPTVFKPEMIPEDFSAFENFKINKHSYWEKSYEEMVAFLETGAFPEVTAESQAQEQPTQTSFAETVQNKAPTQPFTETVSKVEETLTSTTPVEQPSSTNKPFTTFSF